MADHRSQPRMRTRGMRGETGQGQDVATQHRLESSSSEGQTTDQERSSVTEPAADSMSANGGLLDLEEPVLVITRAVFLSLLPVSHGRVSQISCEIYIYDILWPILPLKHFQF